MYIEQVKAGGWRQERVKLPTRGEDTKMWQHWAQQYLVSRMCYDVALAGHKTTGWLRCQLRAQSVSEKVELLSLMQKRAKCANGEWRFCTDVSPTSIYKVNKVTVDENVQWPRIKFVKTQLLFQIKWSPKDNSYAGEILD